MLFYVGHSYQYEWSLISKTQGSGQAVSMNDQNGSTLKLSHLVEGLYTFKVTVTGTGVSGETQANVTVLPRKFCLYISAALCIKNYFQQHKELILHQKL